MTSSRKTSNNPRALIISVSSDIGHALAKRWRQKGVEVAGTYRTKSRQVKDLEACGVKTFRCDLGRGASIRQACRQLAASLKSWDYLVLCPGTLTPVGSFTGCDFTQWKKSVEVNFLGQMQVVHGLLPSRNQKGPRPPTVLFFAGGGTNNATVNYSAYTISKIALIKMCELLDAEIPDTTFAIAGPGWVKTKIHQATLRAGAKAGDNYGKTVDKLAGAECTPMETVLDCCDWLLSADRPVVSGRNFSVVFDRWASPALVRKLKEDPHMYKLRRHGNDWK